MEFGGQIFQQTVGILMGTNCAPLLADLFLYSTEADLIQGLMKADSKRLVKQFNFTYRYIHVDDVSSPNNSRFQSTLNSTTHVTLKLKKYLRR